MTNGKLSVNCISAALNRAFLLAVALLLVPGCGTPPVKAPSGYATYNAKDGTFQCEVPQGWEVKGGGKRGPVWATFTSGPAQITIRGDITGSLMAGDDARRGNLGEEAPELDPVHEIHEGMGKLQAEEEFSGLADIAGPDVMKLRLGPARRSEFTAKTSFGGSLHGYRLTCLGHNKRVVAYCVCPDSDWQTLQPAFDHILDSLERGHAEL